MHFTQSWYKRRQTFYDVTEAPFITKFEQFLKMPQILLSLFRLCIDTIHSCQNNNYGYTAHANIVFCYQQTNQCFSVTSLRKQTGHFPILWWKQRLWHQRSSVFPSIIIKNPVKHQNGPSYMFNKVLNITLQRIFLSESPAVEGKNTSFGQKRLRVKI